MSTNKNLTNIIVFAGVILTIVFTPWINVDSLVVPKVIILVMLSFYLVTKFRLSEVQKHINLKVLFFLAFLAILQMSLSMYFSESPIEQQLFGRGGRGLGFLTYTSLFILMVVVSIYFNQNNLNLLIKGIVTAGVFSSSYSLLQRFNLDPIDWVSRTNGIIGTLGNPNFQSAFAAVTLILSISFFNKKNNKINLVSLFIVTLTCTTIYFCQSTQGYVSVVLGSIIYLVGYFWYKSKNLSLIVIGIGVVSSILGVLGMFDKGPFSALLYKYSIESRSEMWRTSISAIRDNPIFGVGIDSFGDYSSLYKSAVDAQGVNEFTDNSHNYFLEYAVTGGIPLALIHILIILFTVYTFLKIFKLQQEFNRSLIAIFAFWVAIQSQSLISPAAIPLLFWNFLATGFIVGYSVNESNQVVRKVNSTTNTGVKFLSVLSLLFALLITYPYFNADRLQLRSLNSGDADLAVRSATMYPESVVRYQRIGVELTKSGLSDPALVVARAAVQFNPNAFSSWALLLANEKSTMIEKERALAELIRLDPYNKLLQDIKLDGP
jgi:O-antigen ligase